MPYINENKSIGPKPLVPKSSGPQHELPTKPQPKTLPEEPKKNLFNGGTVFEREKLDRYLKTPEGQEELRKKLEIPLGDYAGLQHAIENIQQMIPKQYGPLIDRSEATDALKDKSKEVRSEMTKPYATPDWRKEKRERTTKERSVDFLREKMGL